MFGDAKLSGSTPNSSRVCIRSRGVGSLGNRRGDALSQVQFEAVPDHCFCQFLFLGLREPLQFLALDRCLGAREIVLRSHRYVLAGGHGKAPGG